ncbi:MAG: DNA circularization N-terminal domain-containing protein [Oscillospiraceae bacterium]
METAKLKFCGVSLRCNPQSITIQQERKISSNFAIFNGEKTQDFGICLKRISGQGFLFGADVSKQYETLQELLSKGSGMLFIPGFKPFLATFCSLSVSAFPIPNMLSYTFSFLESSKEDLF